MKTNVVSQTELANSYFPDLSEKQARRAFRSLMERNLRLMRELKATGYQPRQRYLSPNQRDLIYHYIGLP